jgi:hypothetical protein
MPTAVESPAPSRTTALRSPATNDRLLWAGIVCFVGLVAGAAWLAPRVVARDLAQQAAARDALSDRR